MTLTRRSFLAAALALGATACASPTTASPGRLTLLYTKNGLADGVLADAVRHFGPAALNLSPTTDLRQRLFATLSGQAYLPDITMVGDDIALYFQDADQFADLRSVGAQAVESEYLGWKWQSGATASGQQIGFPIDIGPAALYYRQDVFAEAGMPSEPDEVAAAVATWEDYFDFAERVQRKLPGRYLITDTKMVFTYVMAQLSQKYFDKQGRFVGDQPHVRQAWDRALTAFRRGLTAGYSGSQDPGKSVDRHAAWNGGKEVSFVNASWVTSDLKKSAPNTAGKWRVCRSPGGAGNQGGSYLTVTRACPRPDQAFEVVRWLMSPENQVRAYLEAGLFPSSLAAYTDPRLLEPEPFFGGQATMSVFGKAATEVRPAYFSAYDIQISDTYTDELTNVELGGKDPERAWADAQSKVDTLLRRKGAI
ncbi:ABC transporter substrate-binding protein [Crossiella cryophila]|uniref:Cellobiose transport system substrate-binding protein n=1 Tax=Crossiella cryophila TaxID=43355 RepID=A0A7W7FWN9_9PSEU|nr:extracellular solute-binding protein [Crossiella cryophila]MBB4680240.1 cellobiose transport system substrate-binding protein [Crossiella cryophila]